MTVFLKSERYVIWLTLFINKRMLFSVLLFRLWVLIHINTTAGVYRAVCSVYYKRTLQCVSFFEMKFELNSVSKRTRHVVFGWVYLNQEIYKTYHWKLIELKCICSFTNRNTRSFFEWSSGLCGRGTKFHIKKHIEKLNKTFQIFFVLFTIS